MDTVSKFDMRWDELFAMALFWSEKSYEALSFKQQRDVYVTNLHSAPTSQLISIRHPVENLVIAAAGCRVACECVKVDFVITDPDCMHNDNNWETHRALLAKIATYAKEQNVSYVHVILHDILEYQPLLAELSKLANTSGRIKKSEMDQVQFLLLPHKLEQFSLNTEKHTPAT